MTKFADMTDIFCGVINFMQGWKFVDTNFLTFTGRYFLRGYNFIGGILLRHFSRVYNFIEGVDFNLQGHA